MHVRVASGGQVGVQGATMLAKDFFALEALGSTDGLKTFSWEAHAKTFVCNKNWTPQYVLQLLKEAVSMSMQQLKVDVVME